MIIIMDVISQQPDGLKGGVRVWCKDAFKTWSELLWKGTGHCSTSVKVSANVENCAAVCDVAKSKDIAAISALKVAKLDVDLEEFHCAFSGGQGIKYLPDILAALVSPLKRIVVDALQKPLMKAINQVLDNLIHTDIPSTCYPRARTSTTPSQK